MNPDGFMTTYTSQEGQKMVDVAITLVELRGVVCYTKKRDVLRKKCCFTVLSESEPNVKAVVSYRPHESQETKGGGNRDEYHISSLRTGEESMDAFGNLVISCAWPDGSQILHDNCSIKKGSSGTNCNNSTIRLSREIRTVALDNSKSDKTLMTVPAVTSLQVGLIVDKSDVIQPLGTTTIKISGEHQSIEICLPVDSNPKGFRFCLKDIFQQNSSIRRYCVGDGTILRIQLTVTPKPQHDRNGQIERSAVSSIVPEPTVESRSSFAFNQLRKWCKEARKKLASSQHNDVRDPEPHNLPELTVLSPSPSFDKDSYYHNGGSTEIVLTSCAAVSTETAVTNGYPLDDKSCSCEIETKPSDVSTILDKYSVIEVSDKSVGTQDTNSTSEGSSNDDVREIQPKLSKSTFEESVVAQPEDNLAAEKLFTEDVTTQLDHIVRVYSMKMQNQKLENVISMVSDDLNTGFYPIDPTLFDTAAQKQKCGVVEYYLLHDYGDAPSVVKVHEDEQSGAEFSVEISSEGNTSPTIENQLTTINVKNDDQEALQIDENKPQYSLNYILDSRETPRRATRSPIKTFEGGMIALNKTLSSLGELTVDSTFDTIPTAISETLVVEMMKQQHPRRRNAFEFFKQISCSDIRYDCAELVDDAVVGFKGIIAGEDLCDGMGDESTTLKSDFRSNESTLSKSTAHLRVKKNHGTNSR